MITGMFPRLFKSSYAPLVPWVVVAALLAAALGGTHALMVTPAHERLAVLEADWAAARQALARRLEARQTRKDLAQILTVLPGQRDFARLPLAISEIAQRDRVVLPSLTYTLGKTDEGLATKAVLQGTVTGQYEDLRRFIHHLEVSDRLLLFVEDLSVGRSSEVKGERKDKLVTVNLRLATFIREESRPGRALKASIE